MELDIVGLLETDLNVRSLPIMHPELMITYLYEQRIVYGNRDL